MCIRDSFWSSIRPNGPQRPHVLDRLELRICDYVSDIELLLAITALLELRVIYLFENLKTLDPLISSEFSMDQLTKICYQKEIKAVNNVLKNPTALMNGPCVQSFEQKAAKIFGKKYGLMVNSGSSANLLALAS